MWAASPGPTSTAGAASGSVAIEPASKLVRNDSPSTGTSAVVPVTSPRSTPPSATIPSRRVPAPGWTTTRLTSAVETIRAAREAGLARSIGTYAQPALSVPSIAAIVGGSFGRRRATRSPGRQPDSTSACAKRLARVSSVAERERARPGDERRRVRACVHGARHPLVEQARHAATAARASWTTRRAWSRSSASRGMSVMIVCTPSAR